MARPGMQVAAAGRFAFCARVYAKACNLIALRVSLSTRGNAARFGRHAHGDRAISIGLAGSCLVPDSLADEWEGMGLSGRTLERMRLTRREAQEHDPHP